MDNYTEEEKAFYEKELKARLDHIGYTPKEYELYMMKLGVRQEVSKMKGERYLSTPEEVEYMAYIWETYGKPNI